jgi:hypothetical protein
MIDNIVERLRRMSPQLDILQCECVLQAADCIEALEAALRKIKRLTEIYRDATDITTTNMREVVRGVNDSARAALAPEQDK